MFQQVLRLQYLGGDWERESADGVLFSFLCKVRVRVRRKKERERERGGGERMLSFWRAHYRGEILSWPRAQPWFVQVKEAGKRFDT